MVYDNNGKDMDSCKPLIDHFQVSSTAAADAYSQCALRTSRVDQAPYPGHVARHSQPRASQRTPVSHPARPPPLAQHKVNHYVFVSSAGAYKADPIEPCHFEGDARKSSAGHVEVRLTTAAWALMSLSTER